MTTSARETGTTLNNLKVISLGQNSKHDLIAYTYRHESGEHGPYQAFVPRGNIERLGLEAGKMYRIRTAKINRQISLDICRPVEERSRHERSAGDEKDYRGLSGGLNRTTGRPITHK